MKDDVYSRLCSRMNEHPIGSPETKEFIGILKTFFTPEEAELATILNWYPEPLSEIATSSGRDENGLKESLDKMADKGLVYKEIKDGKELYHAFSSCPGFWELSFAKGEKNPRTEYLAKMWREYYRSGWWKVMHPTKTPMTRIFPVNKSISQEQQVLPFEKAAEILKKTEHICVIHCPCRTAAELAGEGCGKPKETCLILGYLAKFMSDRGFGRKVENYEDALAILEMTEKAGLVHLTMNTEDLGDDALGICSCCSCCCTQLRAMTEMGKEISVAKSRFSPVLNEELCIACGVCEERCPTHAMSIEDDLARVSLEKCIGCGLCVTGCPEEALSLQERQDYQGPLADIDELFDNFLREKAENT